MGEESIWKKEVSFERKSQPKEDEVSETPADEETPVVEPVVDEPEAVVDEPEAAAASGSDQEPGPTETVWKGEVSFERKPTPTDAEPTETEPKPAEALWKKEVSFSRKTDDEIAAEEPVAEEPVADVEPVAEEQPVAKVEPAAEEQPAAEEDSALDEQPEPGEPAVAEAEPWNAPPVMPPAPMPALEPETPTVVQPSVPAAELPAPAPDKPSVPFWKKEISFGGKKGDKAPKVEHPPVPVAELPAPAADKPSVPFWKKDLSFGGKRRDKAPKVKAERQPKPKAERKPKLKAERKPKEPKQPKTPRVKEPKVKAERGAGAKGAKRLVGLKIGASQLAAAKVSNNGTAELQQVARGPLDPGIVVGGELRDPDALAEALKEFFSKHGLPKRGVRLGIANNRIGVRTFEIAGIADPKQLANAVRFRAQEALPIPIDEAVLDYQVLGEGVGEDGEPTKRILLVVAYRELIDRYVDACKKAGITLVGIDLEAFALLRALQAPQDGVGSDPSAALVVVAIGHERATFAVSDGRVCEFTRVLDWGGSALNVAIARVVDAAPSEVEGAKRALALTDEMVPEGLTADQAKRSREAMRRAIQAFARELVSSLQYYQNQPGSLGIGEIVLTGGTAHLPGLAGELERLIGVRVRVGDPLARMKVAKKVGEPEQIGSLAVAIGLGIED